MNRYSRNMNMLSPEENLSLKNFKVCVIGCGGLGGYIIELLGRLGIGYITAVDGDSFDETNLNRQVLSDESVLGKKKALIAKERMGKVNSTITVHPITELFTAENGESILKDHDIVVDALDNIKARLLLQQYCKSMGIPFVHGAIAGWYGQVSTVFPGDDTLNLLYSDQESSGAESYLGNPSFTPALVASIQVGEVLKVLLKKGSFLRRQLLSINLLDNDYEIIQLNDL